MDDGLDVSMAFDRNIQSEFDIDYDYKDNMEL